MIKELNLNSTVFGPYRRPTNEEYIIIRKLIEECPVAIFQSINRLLNQKSLCISIDTIEDIIIQEEL